MEVFFHIFKVISWNSNVSCSVVCVQGYQGKFIPKALLARPVHNIIGHGSSIELNYLFYIIQLL